MNKIIHPKNLLPSLCLICSISVAIAEQATLSNDLNLHIPVIKFQDRYLSADFDYIENSTGALTFVVKEYGFLVEETIPPELSDLSIVTNGPAPAIVDITATEARLTFTSSIPLACSVIYGETSKFGSVAVDPNMNGGAIIDHNPILSNLEADTLYFYRVQGADAQGNLYWAPISSFTTADESLSDDNLLSLSNGATITAVSSNFGQADNDQIWGANSAIDGSVNSAWSSAGDGDNAFIEVLMAQTEQIANIEVWSRAMSDGSAKIQSFTITIDSGEVLGPFELKDTLKAYQFSLDRRGSSIRLDVVSSSGGNTGLVEISAYSQ